MYSPFTISTHALDKSQLPSKFSTSLEIIFPRRNQISSSTPRLSLQQGFSIFLMDWQGQKLSEQLMQIMLVASALIAFSVGYVIGSFRLMLLIYLGGVILTTLITVPNWPFFNRHPLKWLDSDEAERNPKPSQTTVVVKKKK